MHPVYFFAALVVVISAANLLIVFADSDTKIIYSSWMLIINSAIAAGLSIFALLKEKGKMKKDKTDIYLTFGLIFYFLANIVWGYYELVLDIVSPMPSLADLFLMSAYGFLIFRLTMTIKNLVKVSNKKIIFVISAGTGIFLAYILNLTLSLSEVSNFRGLMLFVVTIVYPILNSILTVLALTVLLNLKNEKQMTIPWICELVGLLAIVLGDSWFAVIVLTAFVDQIWISAVLISAHYLLIAGGLMWYILHSSPWNIKRFNLKNLFKSKKIFDKKLITGLIAATLVFTVTAFIATNFITISGDSKLFIGKNLDSRGENNTDYDIIFVGAIVPQTGSLSSIGKPIVSALKKAELDVNRYYEENNSISNVKLLVADSKTSSEDTVSALKTLNTSGAKVIVGPATSTAVAAVMDFAKENNITLLSYASTSPILSIEGDNLYRLVPDDITQGRIMAEKMIDDGIKVIIPFWRGDIYGNELEKATRYYFEKLGGTFLEGINYSPYTGKFATSLHRINFLMWNQELKELNEMVSDAVSKYGPASVGVYTISYDEITPILIQAQLFDSLGKVRWYGSDSIAENHHITKNLEAASFAAQTRLSNPLFSISSDSSNLSDFEIDISELNHGSSMTYAALAYDSFWIAAMSVDKHKNYYNNNDTNFGETLLEVAESYVGVSGKIELNEAGDRISDSYDFWTVTRDNHTKQYEWHNENSADSNTLPTLTR